MKQRFILVLALLSVTFLYRCAPVDSSAGTGTQTGNPGAVAGTLYQPDGVTPAAGVSVKIRPKNTLADTTGFGLTKRMADTATVTTDDSGRFVFDSTLDTGTYVIEADDGDSNLALIDSVRVVDPDSTVQVEDTLRPAGAITGVVYLSEGGDPRKVFILALGLDRFTRPDSTGRFTFGNIAEAVYDLTIISSLDDYAVLEVPGVAVFADSTRDLDTLRLRFTGIPTPRGLTLSYDTLRQIVTLTWSKADTALVKGYNVYRRNVDSNTVLTRINVSPITDTLYRDSTGIQDQTYEYRVSATDKNATEGTKSAGVGVEAIAAFTLKDTVFSVNGELENFSIGKDNKYFCFNFTSKKVQVYDTAGVLKTEWATFNEALSSFKWKKKIGLDDSSYVYVANYGLILKYDTLGNLVDTVYSYNESANEITALSFFKDTLFFTEYQDRKVHAISTTGDTLFTFSNNWQQGDKLRSLACDNMGNVYVYCEVQGRDRIQVFDKAGTFKYEISESFGDVNIFISQSKILLAGYGNVTCLELNGSPVFQISVQTTNIYQSPVSAYFKDSANLYVGLLEGYVARYSRD